MAAQLPNVWHLRTVAEASSKSCYICYKPTTGVLITPDNKVRHAQFLLVLRNITRVMFDLVILPTYRLQDHFYVCKTHLKDKGFANPIVDEKVEAEKRKKEALDRQIEEIKKEYEERQKQKKAKKKSKDDKDKKKDDAEDDAKAEKERDDKVGPSSV